jgi:4'-phosphopantetheinyl transferase
MRAGEAHTEFVASHAAVRGILASYVGVAPAEVPLTSVYGKKPRLASSEFEISLAHRDQVALLALASESVGVDIERCDAFAADEVDDVAWFILTKLERQRLLTLPRHAHRLALARAWVAKEAVLKALGAGLGDISLAEIATEETGRAHAEGRMLAVHQLFPGEPLIAAVATLDLNPNVALRLFEDGVS